MRHSCSVCGKVSDQKKCPKHRGDSKKGPWSKNRDRAAQARFRREVLARDGHRCTFTIQGQRCTATKDLRACHIRPLRDLKAGDPLAYHVSNGRTLCATHDRLTDPYAR